MIINKEFKPCLFSSYNHSFSTVGLLGKLGKISKKPKKINPTRRFKGCQKRCSFNKKINAAIVVTAMKMDALAVQQNVLKIVATTTLENQMLPATECTAKNVEILGGSQD